jgi:uncharacterized YccA/Bax inhibitor family protein
VYRYNNPTIRRLNNYTHAVGESATYGGIAAKCLYFVFVTLAAAAASFILLAEGVFIGSSTYLIILLGAPFVAFICSLIASFRPTATPVAGSLYALLQGITIGFVSFVYEAAYSGVIFTALISTVSVLIIMMVLYYTGIIRVGSFFRKFMISALLGVLFAQFIILIVSLFSPQVYMNVYGNSNLAIFVSIVMVILASLMILFNLQTINEVVENNLEKVYEWTAAFGLLITLIWLYLEFLRLFTRIASRNR